MYSGLGIFRRELHQYFRRRRGEKRRAAREAREAKEALEGKPRPAPKPPEPDTPLSPWFYVYFYTVFFLGFAAMVGIPLWLIVLLAEWLAAPERM